MIGTKGASGSLLLLSRERSHEGTDYQSIQQGTGKNGVRMRVSGIEWIGSKQRECEEGLTFCLTHTLRSPGQEPAVRENC
jgi:hypothetical protein